MFLYYFLINLMLTSVDSNILEKILRSKTWNSKSDNYSVLLLIYDPDIHIVHTTYWEHSMYNLL